MDIGMGQQQEKAAAERAYQDCANTKAPSPRVPDKDILLRWINDAERNLIDQLSGLQKAKDQIQYADNFTCELVKQIIETGASPRQR